LNRVINRVLTRTSSSRVNPRKNRLWFTQIIFAGLVIFNKIYNPSSISIQFDSRRRGFRHTFLGSEVRGRSMNR
ncbi:unnamed protein product, partial [Brassica oleracea var. botrytis]